MSNKIIVYDKCGGVVTVATFLGDQWWITSKDEKLVPLIDDSPYAENDYRYLCEVGEMIKMRDLAGLMGGALEWPEGDIKDVLNNRLKELNLMGVTFVSSSQHLNLKVRVFSNEGTKRKGAYSVWCEDMDSDRFLFDIDNFQEAKTAFHWARVYMDFFLKHGVKCITTLRCKDDVLEMLDGLTSGLKIEHEI